MSDSTELAVKMAADSARSTPVSGSHPTSSDSDPEHVAHRGSGHRNAGHGGGSLLTRMREAAGTVYGDIGTSVLYTVMEITRETIHLRNHDLSPDLVNTMIASGGSDLLAKGDILGGLSLIFWALIFITIKYDLLIMRADNRGEGGTFALWGLLKGYTGKVFGVATLTFLVVTAAGLLAADGIITPPVSMLGAYEPLGENLALFVTLVSLFVLFKAQWRGTSKIGGLFGWFMLLIWFPWIAIKGLPWMIREPGVFAALSPHYAVQFLLNFPGLGALVILGVVVLAITGGEAKYADIGHFTGHSGRPMREGESVDPRDSGRRPVMYTWLFVVLPCLILNYAGQVGYMLQKGIPPRANAFYALTPQTGIESVDKIILGTDMVIAAIAAFIASQALISGMFSIVKQAIVLGFSPRHTVRFTSRETDGQVYIPLVNWAMFIGCVVVTLMFRTASNLAAAYGIAVTGTMGITTLAFGYVAYYRWNWKLWQVYALCTPIMAIDMLFFVSNMLKFTSGGYFPVMIAAILVTIMVTWQWGRKQLAKAFYDFGVRDGKKLEWLVALREMLDELEVTLQENLPFARSLIQGRRRLVESDRAAVFLCSRPIRSLDDYVPVSLRIFLKKYGVLPSHVTLFYVNQVSVAEADPAHRYEVINIGHDIDSVIVTYGYMEKPDIRGALRELHRQGRINIAAERWIVEVGEEEIILDPRLPWWRVLQVEVFKWVLRLSTPAHKYFGLTFDAAVSKEIIPVVFSRKFAKVRLPELEIVDVESSPKSTPPASATATATVTAAK